MISKDILNRNSDIIKDKLVKDANKILDTIVNVLNSELSHVGFGFFYKAGFNLLYKPLIQGNVKSDIIKMMDEILSISKNIIVDDIKDVEEEVNNILEIKGKDFLKSDVIMKLVKKHKNLPRIIDILKELYVWYIINAIKLLRITDISISTYRDLYVATFPYAEGMKNMMDQSKVIIQILKIIEEDPKILRVPFSSKLLYDILVKGYMLVIDEVKQEIQEIYQKI